jgi:hypothetical protein
MKNKHRSLKQAETHSGYGTTQYHRTSSMCVEVVVSWGFPVCVGLDNGCGGGFDAAVA